MLIAIGGLALLLGYISDHPRNTIYATIPWRSGAVDQDPHWWTSFEALGFQSIQGFSQLPIANFVLDPWSNYRGARPYIQLIPGDGSWSIAVGHGLVRVRVGETISLHFDTIGLEARLLRQGIEHGYLADMQLIYGERRDLTELATAVATNN